MRASANSSETVPEAASAASASAKACNLSASPTTMRGWTFQPAVNCLTSGSTFGNVGRSDIDAIATACQKIDGLAKWFGKTGDFGSARTRQNHKVFLCRGRPDWRRERGFVSLLPAMVRAKPACARHRSQVGHPDLSAPAPQTAGSPAHGRYRRAWPWHVPASMPIRKG